MNEKPGCRVCGNQHYHVPLCPYWIDWFSEPTPVMDSERKDFGRMAQAIAESLGRTEYDPRAYDPNCYYCRNGWCHDHEKGPGRVQRGVKSTIGEKIIMPTENTPEVAHLLFCLIEECSEVQKACAKALRFGLDDTYRADNERGLPRWDLTPRQEIRHELNDIRGVVAMLRNRKILPELDPSDDAEESAKITKVENLMEYAREQGTL